MNGCAMKNLASPARLLSFGLLSLPLLAGCDALLAELDDDDDDPLAELALIANYYEGDDFFTVEGDAATMKSDRNLSFGFDGANDQISKVEVTADSDAKSMTCEPTDNDGNVSLGFVDWPGSSTDYTVTVHAGDQSRTFGPLAIAVEAPGEVVSGSVSMGDQGNDGNGYGPFFQSRRVGWGGGWNYANFDSVKLDGVPRLIDFALLTIDGQLTAVSPDLILDHYSNDFIANECGFQTTSFAAYDGALDPTVAELTLDEVQGLPDPEVTATTLSVDEGARFVYRTSDGKKGLIKVEGIQDNDSGKQLTTAYSSAQ